MPVSITPLLAERLDISEERARSLLKTMLKELRRRAETDGVRLPELGTFRVEEGTLTFVPSPSLRRRVNQEYEGLSAEEVPLMPAAEPSPVAAPEPGSDEMSKEAPEEEPAPAFDDASEDDKAVPEPAVPPAPQPAARDRSLDSFTIISLVLAFLFVLGAGWYVLDRTHVLSSGPSESPPVASEEPVPDPAPDAASDTVQQQFPDTATTGTDGAPNDEAPTTATAWNWTIVVASRSSRTAAEAAADEYKTRFDSVAVISGTVDNQTWYRVAVGPYASEEAAKRALDERAAALPPGAWLHRLR